jgi:Ca2+-binding RTX toxin-like protein
MRLFPVVLVLLGLVASPAGAATMTMTYTGTIPGDRGSGPTDSYRIAIVDDAGEANRIRVRPSAVARDDATPLQPGPGCAVRADGWVACRPPPKPNTGFDPTYDVRTGAGDDVLVTEPDGRWRSYGSADLGPGDDGAEVTNGVWRVAGGEGADALHAAGLDVTGILDGGPGADRIAGASARATYERRTAPVRVMPDGIADDGEAGEGDDIAPDVRGVTGGSGPDVLAASAVAAALVPADRVPSRLPAVVFSDPDRLVDGGPGDDRLIGTSGSDQLGGGPGDDVLVGGGGGDFLRGEAGADRIEAGPGDDGIDEGLGADVVDGGPGDDLVSPLVTLDAAPDRYRGGPGRDRFVGSTLSVLSDGIGDFMPSVSLDDRPNDGLLGERDDVGSDFESVELEQGRLSGSDGPDTLSIFGVGLIDGRGGDDVMTGGEDAIGGPGRDRIIRVGARGWDARKGARVDVRDGERDDVTCTVPLAGLRRDRGDSVRGCAGYAYPGATPPHGELRRGATQRVLVRCVGRQVCRGRVTLRAQGSRRTIARGSFRIAAGGSTTLRLKLGRFAFLLRRACRQGVIAVSTRDAYAPGHVKTVRVVRFIGAPIRCRR